LSLVQTANGPVESFGIYSFWASTRVGTNVKGEWNSGEDFLATAGDHDDDNGERLELMVRRRRKL
jgi:hypothetical protein